MTKAEKLEEISTEGAFMNEREVNDFTVRTYWLHDFFAETWGKADKSIAIIKTFSDLSTAIEFSPVASIEDVFVLE